jgi:uncharacterized CHY-type Zn-finger protein
MNELNYCEMCNQEMNSAEYYFCDICPDCRDEGGGLL